MPKPKPNLLGGEILRPDVVDRLLPQLWTTHAAQPPIPIKRWLRNGRHPNAWSVSAMAEALNQAAMQRSKCVFTALGDANSGMTIAPAPAGGRVRWHWAWRTGPLTHQVAVMGVMFPPATASSPSNFTTVQVEKMSGGGVQSDAFHTGACQNEFSVDLQYLRTGTVWLPVDPDTEYQGVFIDGPGARIQSACVWEIPSMTKHFGGYLPQNIPERAPILATDRKRMFELARLLWRRNGSHVLNWFVNNSASSPITTNSATPRNVIDTTVTTISSSSPGYVLDMSYKDRASEASGVPCVMYAYGSVSIAGPAGVVYLKNSSGTTIASVTGFTTTPSWRSVSFNLPATVDKYDIQFAETGAFQNFSLRAVSIFEHGA